jgi:uncharacterized protein (TIGR00255 family)
MALASMTGFGRARGTLSTRFAASVVIRSVNHRYLDVQVRTNLREETPELEAAVRSVVSEAVDRGRVTVQLTLERTEPAATLVIVDGRAVTSALAQLRRIEEEQGGPQTVELRDVLSLPGLVTVTGAETLLEAEEIEALEALVKDAARQLVAMRLEEGERLRGQLDGELEQLSAFLDALEPELGEVRERLLLRLRERIERLIGSEMAADPERLVQEPPFSPTAPSLRGGGPAALAPRGLCRPAGKGRLGRPYARLPVPGDPPRAQHPRVQMPGGRARGASRRGQDGHRAAARAGAESR